jgi:hypothetical protein
MCYQMETLAVLIPINDMFFLAKTRKNNTA